MAENLHKGWLYNREGERFAPATLIESIYARDGSSYYQTLKNHFDAFDDLTDVVTDFQNTTESQFNTVASQISALQDQDSEFKEELQYFDGGGDDILFIVDSNSNVIAYINETGVNSVDFTISTSGISLSGVSNDLNDLTDIVNELDEKVAYFDGSADDAFYFIDVKQNVVAYVDSSGIHATNFFTDEENFNSLVERIVALEEETIPTIEQEIQNLKNTDDDLNDNINDISDRLTYFNGDSDDVLYVIDSSKNVIAYIDGDGVHSIDFFSGDGSFNNIVDRVVELENVTIPAIEEDIQNLQNTDDNLEDVIGAIDERLTYFNGEESDTFYFIDSSKNVVAYIKDGGIYSVDFYPNEGRSVKQLDVDLDTLIAQLEAHETEYKEWNETQDSKIDDLSDTLNDFKNQVGIPSSATSDYTLYGQIDNNTSRIEDLEDKTANMQEDSGETLFIVDNDLNVIAHIGEGGVYSVDFTSPSTTLETVYKNFNDLSDALTDLTTNVGIPASPDYDSGISNLYTQVIENKEDIALATSGHGTSGSIWNNIKGDATQYFTLGSLEDVLGISDADTGTALYRIATNEFNINDIYDIVGIDNQGNATLWGAINDIQSVFGDLFGTERFYFIDSNRNIIAYIDANGLTVTNVTLQNGVSTLGVHPDHLGTTISVTENVLALIE